ncbi:MAG: hypothetical protein LBU69_04985 [Deltaproteobacteria bacterium]|jgi:hypothetical protein|nr:hypothetical protein [Deltaproteobacteria bacterium]
MNNHYGLNASDYLAFHELDLQNSKDLVVTKVLEATIPCEAIRKARNSLGLSHELMAILLGINLPAMIRYENLSLPPYPQGAVSRKMAMLINWLADPKSSKDIAALLERRNGLATLSGLLQAESVITYVSLAGIKNDSSHAEHDPEADKVYQGVGRHLGNA